MVSCIGERMRGGAGTLGAQMQWGCIRSGWGSSGATNNKWHACPGSCNKNRARGRGWKGGGCEGRKWEGRERRMRRRKRRRMIMRWRRRRRRRSGVVWSEE